MKATPAFPKFSIKLAVFLTVLLIGITIYSNTFNQAFHLDDKDSIITNPAIRGAGRASMLWQYYKTRFLTYWSFAVNYQFSRLNPFGYHLSNILIHIIGSYLAYLLALLTFRTPQMASHPLGKWREIVSLFVGLVFLCHPIQTQAVTYIVQRAASLVALFYLATLVFYAKARVEGKVVFYLLALLSGFAAVFSKENSYTLPFAIILYEIMFFGFGKETWKRLPVLCLFFLPLIAIYFAAYHGFVKGGEAESVMKAGGTALSRSDYLLTQFNVLRTYVRLLLLPIHQNLDYDYPVSTHFFEPRTLLSFALLACLFLFALVTARKDRLISFGILWFFLTLSIESSFFPIMDVIFEHRLYLPLFGFGLVAVSLFHSFSKNLREFTAISSVMVLVLSILTFNRNFVWKDEITLWQDVVNKSQRKARPYVNLGMAYRDAKNSKKARELHEKALEIDPGHAPAYNSLGVIYYGEGNYEKAMENFQKAVEIAPYDADARHNIGLTYSRMGKRDKAIESFQEELRQRAGSAGAYDELGRIHGEMGQYEKSIDYYKKALEIDPMHGRAHHGLGTAYYLSGASEQAVTQFKKLIQIYPDYFDAYFSLGSVYAKEGKFGEAIRYYLEAVLRRPKDIRSYNELAVVYEKKGDLNAAIQYLQMGLKVDPNSPLLLENLGRTYIKKGSTGEVSELIEKLKGLQRNDLADQVTELLVRPGATVEAEEEEVQEETVITYFKDGEVVGQRVEAGG